jgi:hypothetical protein
MWLNLPWPPWAVRQKICVKPSKVAKASIIMWLLLTVSLTNFTNVNDPIRLALSVVYTPDKYYLISQFQYEFDGEEQV